MSNFEILMPKLGESVQEATITKWFVKEGDTVDEEDALLEIATDKVDSEIPSPVAGTVTKILFQADDIVPVGEVIALIAIEGSEAEPEETEKKPEPKKSEKSEKSEKDEEKDEKPKKQREDKENPNEKSARFYSPLVKNIADKEEVSFDELEQIEGSGLNGRVQKDDILDYIENRKQKPDKTEKPESKKAEKPQQEKQKVNVSVSAGDEIIEMDRMRKMIGEHMVMSKKVSPHVTTMVECDVTNVVLWRNKVKKQFLEREKEKLTFLPLFLQAIARGLKEYPQVNSSVDGDKIILRKNINLGIAVALPSGNLIVPVIKNADQLNILGLTKELNRLAEAARNNKLKPDEIQGGTFSITNFGTFRNVMGTPIINQPQAAIMAVGTIEKKPAVVETLTGDIIAVRHKMFLSLSYDHRVVDGALGGAFLRRVGDIIEEFDINTNV